MEFGAEVSKSFETAAYASSCDSFFISKLRYGICIGLRLWYDAKEIEGLSHSQSGFQIVGYGLDPLVGNEPLHVFWDDRVLRQFQVEFLSLLVIALYLFADLKILNASVLPPNDHPELPKMFDDRQSNTPKLVFRLRLQPTLPAAKLKGTSVLAPSPSDQIPL